MGGYKARKFDHSVLWAKPSSGVMSEKQLEGILWGYFFRVTKTRDRRGSAKAVGERPKGSIVQTDGGGWASDAGEVIVAGPRLHKGTGLPESASALLPKHRAIYGWDLALSLIIPPEDLICAICYTDDLPQNAGKPEGEKESIALAYKPKFRLGAGGRPVTRYLCRHCHYDWEAEQGEIACRRCRRDDPVYVDDGDGRRPTTALDSVLLDNWSDEEILCVKENTRRLKHVVHRLAEHGLFCTKPKIDEHEAELGTTELVHGEDGRTMGFQITPAGLRFCEEWSRLNPEFANSKGHSVLDAVGRSGAEEAPEWVKAIQRTGDTVLEV